MDELTSKQGMRKEGFRVLENLEPCIVENTRLEFSPNFFDVNGVIWLDCLNWETEES